MAEVVIAAVARTAVIAAATAVAADARPRVTVVAAGIRPRVTAVAADVLLPATAVAAGIRRRAEVPRAVAVGRRRTAVDRRRTAVDRRRVVAADMGGDTALDSFPA